MNFVVPESTYLGCYVPVAIRVRGVISNTAALSINADTNACAHPLGLSYEEMQSLDAGLAIPVANLSVSADQENSGPLRERVNLLMINADAATVALYSGVQSPESSFLTCSSTSFGVAGSTRVAPMDAGPITLLGPLGQEFQMVSPYITTAVPSIPSRFFTPGEWRLRGSGGDVLFPFERSFPLPPVIDSINLRPGSFISSQQELEIRWNGTVFGPNDLVVVFGPGSICTARAWDGRVTLPKPVSSPINIIDVAVVPHPAGRTKFDLALRDGRTMRGFVSYAFSLTFQVVME